MRVAIAILLISIPLMYLLFYVYLNHRDDFAGLVIAFILAACMSTGICLLLSN